ncbi:hypothetical protein [Streptomyces sp. NPDC018693]|uniref:hypothetical protein n=1 Tax=unclassified Streptomyces TaxID=2593676 RepID=UPI0037A2C9E1
MADPYELTLRRDLRDQPSEAELAELRRQPGLGPEPETLRIVTDFPVVPAGGDAELVVENCPEPLVVRDGTVARPR